jgi:hypothetical protein
MTGRQIGTVEILRSRVYNIDPNDDLSPEVVVEPQVCPVYEDGDVVYWTMEGNLNERLPPQIETLWPGTFAIKAAGDSPTGARVGFESQRFGPAAFLDLMAHPVARDGHSEQRLRFNINN